MPGASKHLLVGAGRDRRFPRTGVARARASISLPRRPPGRNSVTPAVPGQARIVDIQPDRRRFRRRSTRSRCDRRGRPSHGRAVVGDTWPERFGGRARPTGLPSRAMKRSGDLNAAGGGAPQSCSRPAVRASSATGAVGVSWAAPSVSGPRARRPGREPSRREADGKTAERFRWPRARPHCGDQRIERGPPLGGVEPLATRCGVGGRRRPARRTVSVGKRGRGPAGRQHAGGASPIASWSLAARRFWPWSAVRRPWRRPASNREPVEAGSRFRCSAAARTSASMFASAPRNGGSAA